MPSLLKYRRAVIKKNLVFFLFGRQWTMKPKKKRTVKSTAPHHYPLRTSMSIGDLVDGDDDALCPIGESAEAPAAEAAEENKTESTSLTKVLFYSSNAK